MNYGIQERKQRWMDFMAQDKPPQHMFVIDYIFEQPRPFPHPAKVQERIEWSYNKYCHYVDQLEWLKDDKIPFLDVYTGTEIFAEAFGCKVHRPENEMPFALPFINTGTEVSKLKVPELADSSLSLVFEIADKLKECAGKEAILRFPDIQSPLDISALIWDKNDFYIALLDEPEAVLELMEKVKILLIAFLDEWIKRYGKENMAHFPDYYMNSGITLSEDEIGVMNQDMFMDFALKDLEELSNRYGGLGIHCCAHAQHQWENFKKIPGLRLINMVQPTDVLKNAYKYFAGIVPMMNSWCGDGEPWTWVEQYPENSRVVIQTTANTREEARRLSEKLWTACGR